MKQTNNAIKFLMAQYRAIFKNANIAMAVALATAALAAGQAQAAPSQDDEALDNAKLKTELQGTAPVTITFNGAGKQADNTWTKFTLTGSGDTSATFDQEFTLKVTSGDANTIDGSGAATDVFSAANASLVLEGATDANSTKLTIGGTKGAVVTLKDLSATKGTVDLKSGSTLTLKSATLGASGALTLTDGSVTADTLTLNSGSTTTITKGTLTATGGITLGTGATITGAGANADDAKIASAVEVSGGTVSAGTAKLTINGALNATSGKVATQKAGELTLNSTANFAGANSFSNASGTITLNGLTTFADGSVDATAAAGTLKIGETTATMSKKTLEALLGGTAVSAVDAKNAVIALTDEKVDLAGDAAATGIFGSGDGALNTKISGGTGGTITLKGQEASFTAFNALSGDVGLAFDTMTLGSGSKMNLQGGVDLTIGKALNIDGKAAAGVLTIEKGSLTLDGAGSVDAKTIALSGANTGDASLSVKKGEWSVNALTLEKSAAATVGKEATLTVGGALTITDADSTLTVDGILSTVGSGSITAVTAPTTAGTNGILLNAGSTMKVDGSDILKTDYTLDDTKLAAAVLQGSGVLNIDLGKDASGNAVQLTTDQFTALQNALTGFKGMFDTNVAITPVEGDLTESNAMGNLKTDAYDEKTLHTDATLDKSYSVGNIMVQANSDLTLATGSNLVLTNSNAEKGNGNFVNKQSGSGTDAKTELGGVIFTDNTNSLTLLGAGNIGAISATAAGGQVVVGMAADATQAGHVTVVKGADIGSSTTSVGEVVLNEASSLTVESGSIFTNNLEMHVGSVANVTGDISASKLSIEGGALTANSLNITGNTAQNNVIDGGAVVDVDAFALGNNQALIIGQDGVPGSDPVDLGSTANVFTQSLTMGTGSSIFVDPSYGLKAATFVTDKIDAATPAADSTGYTVAENIAVGKNAAFGIGFADLAQFEALMADYTDANGSFSDAEGRAKNALILNKGITVTSGKGITVDAGMTQADYATKVSGNSLTLGAGSVMVLTDAAFTNATTGEKTGAAITFENATGTLSAGAGSKVVLSGDFDEGDTKLKIAMQNNGVTAATTPADLVVEYAGGLLLGQKNADGTYSLVFQQDKADQIYNGISRPVGDFIVGKLKDQIAVDQNAAGFKFFKDNVFTTNNWALADTIAHAATYAGAQQAAVASVTTMAEAVGGRVGVMGVEAASISATGSQANGGVWVTPMYKSVDAEGFDAQGGSYGADVDLAGVAFGTDTVNGNMRFGAVFNIGSGDTDGKGAGAGLQDEFDYYGFGIYSVMGFGNFAVVGDASLNVISHDVSGAGLSGKADTTAVTMGVTGQYTIATPSVDVTPHLGARFIRLDTDSYDLNHLTGTIATTDFDVQNVFSVPLGVTLSKAFTAGSWSLAPSADLSITFNTGDTEAGSTTRINGYQYDITMDTEVLDEVQYGLTLGLGAQSGAFGTSFGINYTGSSNTDSFGVNAQARYVF